jgi:hypothetical protein
MPNFGRTPGNLAFESACHRTPSLNGVTHALWTLFGARFGSTYLAVLEAATRVPDRQGRTNETDGAGRSSPWLIGFVLLHLSCQLLLLIPGLSSIRVGVRMAAFGVSLAFLVIIPSKNVWRTPLRACALCILMLLGLEFFHPEGGGLSAALAGIMLNLAVLAPIFWVPRTGTTAAGLQSVVTILWLFYFMSALLGVLQAYYPGRFQPPLSAVLAANTRNQLAGLEIELASGARVFRPMGLTDSPGGAAFAGLYAVLLGTGMLLSTKPPFKGARLVAVASMVAGMMCLYLCQIRSLLVMAGVCELALLALLLISGRISRLVGLLGAVGAIVPGAFGLALAIGGKAMTERLTTLVETDPGSVYYANRGRFLETTLNHYLPLYPLGAGLGRWGMVHAYFGDAADSLWVEIQWTAWLFDGGVAMILLYVSAILIASWGCLKVARGRIGAAEPSLSLWGAVIVAYNVGAVAICFNYPLFGGTSGVEFWLLNMAVLCAAHDTDSGVLRSRLV